MTTKPTLDVLDRITSFANKQLADGASPTALADGLKTRLVANQ
jgi:hypothetical protein